MLELLLLSASAALVACTLAAFCLLFVWNVMRDIDRRLRRLVGADPYPQASALTPQRSYASH